MNEQEKILTSIIKNTHLENKNKHEILYILTGLLSNIILTKIIFNKNSDIRTFTNDYLQKSYKDYLFKSRPLLYSKMIKDAFKKDVEVDELRHEAEDIIAFISSQLNVHIPLKNDSKNKIKKKSTYNSDTISEWREVINPGRRDN